MASKNTTSSQAREMWEPLAQAEDEHYALLERTREDLTTEGMSHFDEQKLPFFRGQAGGVG